MELNKNIQPEFKDDRGGIFKLLDDGKTIIKSVLLITSKNGAIRANHYHRKDSHYVYLVSGKMEYSEAPLINGEVDNSKKTTVLLEAGDLIYTAPMVAHAMRFLEDSVFLALATEWRKQTDYENDLVRVKVI